MKPNSSSGKIVFWGGFTIFLGTTFFLIFWSLYFSHYNAEDAAYDEEYQKTAHMFQIDWPQSRFEIALPSTFKLIEQTSDLVTFQETETRAARQMRIAKASAPLDRREAQRIVLKTGGELRYIYTREHNPGSGGDTILVNASLSLQNQNFAISCSMQDEWPSPSECLYYIKQIKMMP